MLKIKLEDRITVSFAGLFLILILLSNLLTIYFLKKQSLSGVDRQLMQKETEIHTFLDRISSYSERYDKLSLNFNMQIDGKKLVYPKPFDPGNENLLYIVSINNEVAINSFYNIDFANSNSSLTADSIMKTIETHSKGMVSKNISTVSLGQNEIYRYKNITQDIKGIKFDIYILKNISQENKIFDRLRVLILFFTVLGILITVFISIKISKVILKPINNVMQTGKLISTDDLSKRIEVINSGDELEELTKILNQMLDRIQKSFESQSKFVSDASHELRTPLAIIKGYAEIIKKRRLSNEEVFDESIDAIINETENMKNLVQKLLMLAKGEEERLNITLVKTPMQKFIKEIAFDSKLLSVDHDIVLARNDNYSLNIDRSLIKQGIRALIENAIKYSPADTTITIDSYIEEGKAHISVSDMGIGIDKSEHAKIFERFYRVDESRSKDTGGTGLGLAIVKKIADAHNSEILVDSEINKGTKITLLFTEYSEGNDDEFIGDI
jgi:two-component system sensor histidine kinase ArlS